MIPGEDVDCLGLRCDVVISKLDVCWQRSSDVGTEWCSRDVASDGRDDRCCYLLHGVIGQVYSEISTACRDVLDGIVPKQCEV